MNARTVRAVSFLGLALALCQCDRSFDFLVCQDQRAGLVCGLAPQCGCEIGERCAIIRTGASVPGTRSCVRAGTGRDGAACTGHEGCARGFECWNGVCRILCDPGDANGCGTGRACVQVTGDNSVPVRGGGVCFGEECDPLTSYQCTNDRRCTSFTYTHTSLTQPFIGTTCIVSGPAGLRDPCGNVYDCARGFVCAASTCRTVCRVGSDADCAMSGTDNVCNPWRIPEVVNGINYGFCGTPGEQG